MHIYLTGRYFAFPVSLHLQYDARRHFSSETFTAEGNLEIGSFDLYPFTHTHIFYMCLRSINRREMGTSRITKRSYPQLDELLTDQTEREREKVGERERVSANLDSVVSHDELCRMIACATLFLLISHVKRNYSKTCYCI